MELKSWFISDYESQFSDDGEVYNKDEADCYIAHQKMKRCVAMADFWAAKAALLMVVRIGTNNDWYIKKYEIREQKWQELAEHYKEMAK